MKICNYIRGAGRYGERIEPAIDITGKEAPFYLFEDEYVQDVPIGKVDWYKKPSPHRLANTRLRHEDREFDLCPMRGSKIGIASIQRECRKYEYEYTFAAYFGVWAYRKMRKQGLRHIVVKSKREPFLFGSMPQHKCARGELQSSYIAASANDSAEFRWVSRERVGVFWTGEELIVADFLDDKKGDVETAMHKLVNSIRRVERCI